MPNPSFIGSTFNNLGGSPLFFTAPVGSAVGDLLVMVGVQYNTAGALTTPSGWTEVTGSALGTLSNGTGIGPVSMRIFTKIAVSGDLSSNACYLTGGSTLVGGIYVYRNASQPTTQAAGALSTASSSSLESAPATTTTVNNTIVLHALGMTTFGSGPYTLTFGGSGGSDTGSTQYSNGRVALMMQDIAVASAGSAPQPTAGTAVNHQFSNVTLLIAPPPSPDVTVTGVAAAVTTSAPNGSVLAAGTTATVTGVLATVSDLAPAGTVTVTSTVALTAAAGTVTMTAPAGTVLGYLGISSWTADQSQQLLVPITLDGTLDVDVAAVDPPPHHTATSVNARRLSLVMPTPTLDSRGRPI